MNGDYPLELDGSTFQELAAQITKRLAVFLDTLPQQPAAHFDGAADLARQFDESAPEQGRDFIEILEQLFTQVFPVSLNTTSPGYLAYIPGGGLPHAALADLMALITNRYPGLWSAAPVVATLESAVVRWFAEMVGYGREAGGFLTSGGSIANLSALVVAREILAPEGAANATVYTSHQAHHSVDKAAIIAGIPRGHVRQIETDDQFRIRVDRLEEAISADRQAGLRPLAIIGHAGTTNTGAVDDLTELAVVARRHKMWLHVDAAYGGFFLLTDRGRRALAGIEHADTITLDPHKGLFLPYGTGCLLARNRDQLRRVFSVRGEYMTAQTESDEFVDFCDISPELSRDFRGLRVWLPFQMHGRTAFRACLDEKLDLTEFVSDALSGIPDIEIVARSPLSIVAFRLNRPGWSDEEANRHNRQFLERINASGRVWLTSTTLRGQFVLRICILSFRTHHDRIAECLEIIRSAAHQPLSL